MTEESEKYNNSLNGDIGGDAIATNPSMNSLDEQLVTEESLKSSNTLKKQIGFFQGFTLMIGNFIAIAFSLSPGVIQLLRNINIEFNRHPTHFGYIYTSMLASKFNTLF